jgi:hypothetical protein
MSPDKRMPRPSDATAAPRAFEILVVFSLCLLATLALLYRTALFGPGSAAWNDPVDHWKYEYIADHPLGTFHIQPTCWRIGVPLLTRLLPFSTYRNFEILTILFFALTGVVIYFWLLAIPRPRVEAILGVLLFYSLGSAVKLVLWSVETPDPASYFFTVLALYAIYTDRDYLCAIALAAGMFSKETLAVVAPLHYTLKATRLVDASRLKRSLLVVAPAICVLVGIRILIPAWNDRADYVNSLPFIYTQVSAGDVKFNVVIGFHGVLRSYRGMRPIELLRLFTWGSLGIQMFLPFFNIRDNLLVLLRWAPYWVAVVGSLLVALNADRRVGSLFPVLIVMGLNGLSALARRLRLPLRDFQAVFLLQFGLLLLNKDVPLVPFDLVAAAFLGGLCWLMARNDPAGGVLSSPIIQR